MEFEQITADLTDHVPTITLNRPDRLNAWTFGSLRVSHNDYRGDQVTGESM
jgi:enoyl-CoA hydratase/carnithine racemase